MRSFGLGLLIGLFVTSSIAAIASFASATSAKDFDYPSAEKILSIGHTKIPLFKDIAGLDNAQILHPTSDRSSELRCNGHEYKGQYTVSRSSDGQDGCATVSFSKDAQTLSRNKYCEGSVFQSNAGKFKIEKVFSGCVIHKEEAGKYFPEAVTTSPLIRVSAEDGSTYIVEESLLRGLVQLNRVKRARAEKSCATRFGFFGLRDAEKSVIEATECAVELATKDANNLCTSAGAKPVESTKTVATMKCDGTYTQDQYCAAVEVSCDFGDVN